MRVSKIRRCTNVRTKEGRLFSNRRLFNVGVIPLYWKQMQHVGSVEILVGRVIWSFVFTVVFVLLIRQYKQMIADTKMLWKNKKQFFYCSLPR